VIIESFTIGTPVIASRVGAIPDIIDHGSNGFLIDPSVKDLVNILEKVNSSEFDLVSLSNYAQQSSERWGWEGVSEELKKVYNSLAKETSVKSR
jgi:glycosyltransferase involved in cell wall biosynthesis